MTKKKVFRAGVIPYYFDTDGTISMLFMKPSGTHYTSTEFQIAKGKIEEGEEDEPAAFREAMEELGLFKGNCRNITKLGTFLGRTTIYLAEVIDSTEAMFGDPCDETEETRWITPEEFGLTGRDLHKAIVKAAERAIERSTLIKSVNYEDLERRSYAEGIDLVNWTRWFNRTVGVTQIFETPQLTASYDSNEGLNDSNENNQLASSIIQKHNQQSGIITDRTSDSVTIVDADNNRVKYHMTFDHDNTDSLGLGRPYVIQTFVWRDVSDTTTKGVATVVMFEHLLNVCGTVLCDALHTAEAQKYWLNVVQVAWTKPGVDVYVVNVQTGKINKILDHGRLRQHDPWTSAHQPIGQENRVVITTKPFELTS